MGGRGTPSQTSKKGTKKINRNRTSNRSVSLSDTPTDRLTQSVSDDTTPTGFRRPHTKPSATKPKMKRRVFGAAQPGVTSADISGAASHQLDKSYSGYTKAQEKKFYDEYNKLVAKSDKSRLTTDELDNFAKTAMDKAGIDW